MSQSVLGHREHHAVPQDAGVVDHDVDVAESVDGLLHHGPGIVEAGHAAAVDDRLSPARGDGLDHLGRGRHVGTSAELVAAQVVDHHLGPVLGEHQGVLAADAAPRAGDERHFAFEKPAHGTS